MEISRALDYAQQEVENLNSQEEFLLKDLFKGYVWNRIKKSDRIKLGTLFLNYVEENPEKVNISTKTISGQKVYKKI